MARKRTGKAMTALERKHARLARLARDGGRQMTVTFTPAA